MQVMDWITRCPGETDLACVIASSVSLNTQALAYDVVGRGAITDDPDWNKIECGYDEEADVYTLSGRQLTKIFNSTNFFDMGSLRYLYKYIEKNGAIERLKELGLQEGDTIRINDYEMEFWDEY